MTLIRAAKTLLAAGSLLSFSRTGRRGTEGPLAPRRRRDGQGRALLLHAFRSLSRALGNSRVHRVGRRDLIAFIVGIAVPWPVITDAAVADPVAGKLALIGVLANAPVPPLDSLREGLRDLGYVEGENFRLEYRWAEGRYDRYPDLAAELVALPVDAIVTVTTPAALGAQRTTSRIPIIMAAIGDPISIGLVSNLAHPGGNITGFSSLAPDLVVKRVEFLKDLVPTLSRLVVLSNTTNPYAALELERVQPAAVALGIRLQVVSASDDAQLNDSLETIRGENSGGALVINDQFLLSRRDRIVSFMAETGLPAVYGYREFVDIGGLASYATDYRSQFRRAAGYVDKVLHGAKPGDFPVQQPTKFEFIFNMRTATALGLSVQSAILARADEVIE
jgi:putative ABC transport system substrate-binding protein